jgi:hypothetical protein
MPSTTIPLGWSPKFIPAVYAGAFRDASPGGFLPWVLLVCSKSIVALNRFAFGKNQSLTVDKAPRPTADHPGPLVPARAALSSPVLSAHPLARLRPVARSSARPLFGFATRSLGALAHFTLCVPVSPLGGSTAMSTDTQNPQGSSVKPELCLDWLSAGASHRPSVLMGYVTACPRRALLWGLECTA